MKCLLKLRLPSEDPIRFVEYKRPFLVEGEIISDNILPKDASLTIKLINEEGLIVRHVFAPHKYPKLDLNNKLLKGYEDLDKDKSILKEYGFSAIVVNDDGKGINSAINKCWFSDTRFEAIIVSASNKEHGAIFNFGFDFKDENNNDYCLLPIGKYCIEVLLKGTDLNCSIKEEIEIGKRDNQIICRFNPLSHKKRMIKWCADNNYMIIKDTLPGYLEPYMGKWYYHMGILKMYHAADVCMYDDIPVKMFDYLIDEASTSYGVELGFLNSRHLLEDEQMLEVYYYDIGEAIINKRQAKVLKFLNNEYLQVCRVDILKNKQDDNIYYLDNRNVKDSLFESYVIDVNDYIAIMGIVRPMQFKDDEVILNEETNTYIYKNYPKYLRYSFEDEEIIKEMNMERIENDSIGKSVFEFYNVFKFDKKYQGKTLTIKIECLDVFYKPTKANKIIKIGLK